MVKQSVAFGISRNRIFFTKLVLTLTEFLLLCSMGILITLFRRRATFNYRCYLENPVSDFCFQSHSINYRGFVLGFTLMCLTENEVVSALLTLLLFNGAFSEVVSFLEKRIFDHSMLSSFYLELLLNKNTEQFLAKSASITTENWLIGTIVILISLSIGITIYNKKNLLVWGAHLQLTILILLLICLSLAIILILRQWNLRKMNRQLQKIINQFGTNEQLRNNLPGKELNSFVANVNHLISFV